MIAVDSSVLVALVLGEPDAGDLARTMNVDGVMMCAASVLETAMVVEARRGRAAVARLRLFLEHYEVQVVAVDADLAWAAHEAWQRFGKGRHPAALNFGDCLSYALAKSLDVPLLFKGDDFSQTDLSVAR